MNLLLLAAVQAVVSGFGCEPCNRTCSLPFDGDGGVDNSEYLAYHEGFPFRMWSDCEELEKINEEYPNLQLRPVRDSEYAVYHGYSGSFSLYSDMLSSKDPLLGIMNIDIQWVLGLGDLLAPFPPEMVAGYSEQWLERNKRGEVVAAPHRSNSLMLFHRKDLFKKHGIELDFSSWETFEASMLEMQSRESAERGDPSYRAFSFNMIGLESDYSVIFATLLSGHNAGMVVEHDGTVSVNNPAAVKTLTMLKRWTTTLLHPATMAEGNDAPELLKNDDVAVVITWSNFADDAASLNWRKGWNVAAGPVPGPTGAGCSGSWNFALAAHAPMKNLSFRIISTHLDSSEYFTKPDEAPLAKRIYENATLWHAFCKANYILCAGIESYPGFFSRLTHRPSGGCGPLFDNCMVAIKSALVKFLDGTLSPSATVVVMEQDLKVLLGIWEQDSLYEEPSSWTDMKLVAVIVGTASITLVVSLLVYFFLKVNDLRRPQGCSMPLSIFLALMASVLFIVIQVITLTIWYEAFKDVASDLGAEVRQRSLQMVTQATQHGIEASFKEWAAASLTIIKRVIESDFVLKLPTLDLDPRSLILMIDQVEGRIAVSSDNVKQPDGVSIADELTAWGKAGLEAVGGSITGMLNSTTGDVSVDGRSCFLNAETVYYISKDDGLYERQVGYLIVYIVPNEVVLGEADDALEKSVWTSILLLCLGLACLTTASAIITLPLVALAYDMEKVRVMRLDSLLNTNKSSMLTEIASLLLGFQYMCKMINEYKAFMPQTLFMGSDTEADEEKSISDSASRTRSQTSQSHSQSQSRTLGSVTTGKHEKVTTVQLSGLQNVKGAVLSIQIHPASRDGPLGFSLDRFTAVFSAVEKVAHASNGIIHSFSTMHAEEIIVSWGMNGTCLSAPLRAVTAATEIRGLVDSTRVRLALAISAGRFKAGNIGSAHTRGFCVAGAPVKSYDAVVKSASALSRCLERSIVVCDKEGSDLPGFVMSEIDVANVDGRRALIKEVVSRNDGDMQEWMYELDDLKKNSTVLSRFLTSGEKISSATLSQALRDPGCSIDDKLVLENMEHLIAAFPDCAQSCTTLAYDAYVTMQKLIPKKTAVGGPCRDEV
ncbi:hypothetical protein DIPPA_12988 [Diplonema papillatum]|nr:hypothetical protein DIPPA_12988 [Diplonema papillatum]